MRKTAAILAFALLFTYACTEEFSPKMDYSRQYVVYCVLDFDSLTHRAYLSSSYPISGYDPLENTINPAVRGATVKLILNNNTVYTFSEKSAPRTDTSRYKSPVYYYETSNCRLHDEDVVELSVATPDNKTLTSKIKVPLLSYLFFTNSSSSYNPADQSRDNFGIFYAWKFLTISTKQGDAYFVPQFEIVYHKADNPAKKYRYQVPMYFLREGAGLAPKYADVTAANEVTFYRDAIIKSLELISQGDPDKSNYVIEPAEFTLLFLEKNLASYIGAQNTFKGELSMRIDAADFSNITNGEGLFGAYVKKKSTVKFSETYLKSLGYSIQ